MTNGAAKTGERVIRCPACGGPSRYAASNRYRPFCSERCRTHDLGAWASENYRLPEAPASPDAAAGDEGDARH